MSEDQSATDERLDSRQTRKSVREAIEALAVFEMDRGGTLWRHGQLAADGSAWHKIKVHRRVARVKRELSVTGHAGDVLLAWAERP